ncbi:PIGZ-like protein, partial [Mya arenaria]
MTLNDTTCPPDFPRPYCLPSLKPTSQSVLTILSSSRVPLTYRTGAMKQLVIWFALIVVRLAWTLLPQASYIHPDEFFQTVEVVAGDVFNTSIVRTWEFTSTFPLRSITVNKILFHPSFRLLDHLSTAGIVTLSGYSVLIASRLHKFERETSVKKDKRKETTPSEIYAELISDSSPDGFELRHKTAFARARRRVHSSESENTEANVVETKGNSYNQCSYSERIEKDIPENLSVKQDKNNAIDMFSSNSQSSDSKDKTVSQKPVS